VIVEADEKDAKKMDDKIHKAEKAMVAEDKEITVESQAGKGLDLEKKKVKAEAKKEEKKNPQPKLNLKTLPEKDVELRSASLPH